ncbi:hypothetical protein ASD04_06975 [Devosia sp. Root436]|uniref:integrase family protein n=1 Tax=Devosia sp. Root436 TaxID=1736537 RepID=UPI0006FCEA30|nr:integrase family protein [Devosia sp. Root436]KQX40365.1 hypothetical protein ASD04_06975 [Devosia sp. Root436]
MPTIDINARTVAKAIADAKPGAKQSEISDSRARGLKLRIGAQGASWQYRYEQAGKGVRFDLGSVHDWSLVEARELAADAAAHRRKRGTVDAAWMETMLVKHGRKGEIQLPVKSWDWATARTDYLADVDRTKRMKTAASYRNLLTNTPELERFAERAVSTISRREAAKAIADIHARGVEAHAEHVAAVVSAFYTWLGDDARADDTGIEPGHMRGLRAPQRTAKKEVAKPAVKANRYAPPMHEVGRLMAIARSGAINERIGLAIQHMCFTVQRITYIVHARIDGMEAALTPDEGLWRMEPQHRKTAENRNDTTDHVVPLPAPAWAVVQRAMTLTEDLDHHRLFPGFRPAKAGGTVDAMAESAVQHNMTYMPGIVARPHDLRRSFTKFGQSKFRWGIEGSRSILDHNEGFATDDVTVHSYLHDGIGPKWDIMRNWVQYVEEATAEAIDFDKRLRDVEWLSDFIARRRHEIKTGYRKGVSLAKIPPTDLARGDVMMEY